MPSVRVRGFWLSSVLVCLVGNLAARPAPGQSLSRSSPGKLGGPLDDHWDWMLFDEYGWRAMNKGWYDTAEREFTKAIAIAKRSSSTDFRLLARSYYAMAWALQKQGRSADAEPLARWALDTRLARFSPNAEPVVRSLNQLATIDLALNRLGDAETLLRRVIAVDAGGSDTIKLEQAQSESLLGLALVSQRRYAAGEVEFARAVALRAATQGARNPETGDELNNLAWSQIEQGKLAEAKGSMEQALQILAKGRGEADPSVARALDGLARIDTEQKDLGAAELKFRRLIAIYEKLGSGQRVRLEDGLKRYADLLDTMGRADAAKQVRDRLAGSAANTAAAKPNANFEPGKYPKTPAAAPPGRGRS